MIGRGEFSDLCARLEALLASRDIAETRFTLARRVGSIQRRLENRDRRLRDRLQGRAIRKLKRRVSSDLLRRSRDRRLQRLRKQKGSV